MILINAVHLLWLLVLAVLIILEFLFLKRREKDLNLLFKRELRELMLKQWDARKFYLKKVLFFLALFFLIIALAQPQWGKREETLARPGIDVIFAIDVSRSMLAEDLRPNRLENAKGALAMLSDQLAGNRLGLLAFAGSSFLECPLTADIGAVKLFLEAVTPDLIPVPGTDIGGAMRTAVRAFGESKNSKAVILITDGEDLYGGALAAAKEAAGSGVRLYPVGIGTELGAPVPGKPSVVSRLDARLLTEMARSTGGSAFFVGERGTALPGLMAAIASLPRQSIKQLLAHEYNDHFQIFILLSILCLLAEFVIMERKA